MGMLKLLFAGLGAYWKPIALALAVAVVIVVLLLAR